MKVFLIKLGIVCHFFQIFCLATYIDRSDDPLSNSFIDKLNTLSSTWTAGRNFHQDISVRYLKGLMGVLPSSKLFMPPQIDYTFSDADADNVPEEFDSRVKWPHCPTISEIRDQGSCGSCWAIASVEVMSDRTCIHSEGKDNFHYSTEDVLTCCASCGVGCNGGLPGAAFAYWVFRGIVSGGQYGSKQGCVPYEIPSCEHHISGNRPNCTEGGDTPMCERFCNEDYSKDYVSDLRFGKNHYPVYRERMIKMELFTNGPVEAAFTVYSDFVHYKSGVYSYSGQGEVLGGHAIRIIGYGTENGTPYWLCANSWNSDWGDDGLFKILRGSNECSIEDEVIAALPKLD